ncbi:tannase/feruloyl esterase family alpha/beta hydrolase [Duganella sp. sic0402]|uniref:tannase/feruloyl esterase family alpha/beta hydrolase n=1 Tax=Duganella sp. sic0402 TaxID=2854786 RepID=UPI001C44D9F7|nr:tannase/feruloyl esterase family alpha/beta hydrolase [Duganella sp. sic0402]MBV7538689.1 tannase/feruloyl esterase family alpha/beta hydrolase [Duganella sp. sic0402]
MVKQRFNFGMAVCAAILTSLLAMPLAARAAPLDIVRPVQSCASLAQLDLGDVGGAGSHIVKAQESVSAGVTVCAVEGTLAPSIGFSVQLPTKSWTQRYLQLGCGGLCGHASLDIGAADGCRLVQAGGFVTAATDMGHQGMSGEFGQDAQKRADFAHRGVHLTALAVKKLIRAYYGQAARYAYFNGCSDGGREALVEAQRYPDDFNGIIAGAPAMNFQVQNSLYHGWQARSNSDADGKAILLAARLPLLHAAVLKQCDALDGQVDGLIADPRACHFDPAPLQCSQNKVGDAACLSAAEVVAVRKLYDGPRDTASGERLTIGGPQPGSELAWAGVFVPRSENEGIFSERIALDALRNLVFPKNPAASYSLHDLKFDKATFQQLVPLHALYDATNPDLSAFAQSGGKLILWHGWADPHISPLNTIAYHEAVRTTMGADKATGFERLYLLPGVYHCAGGEGPSAIDMLTPMVAWVEDHVAPEAIVAATPVKRPGSFGLPPVLAGRPPLPPGAQPPAGMSMLPSGADQAPQQSRSRPVFPYPVQARYDGKGNPDQASSYQAATPAADYATPAWAGSIFYMPYAPLE